MAQEIDKKKAVELYLKGSNYYDITRELFAGEESEGLVAKVRATLEAAEAEGLFVDKDLQAKIAAGDAEREAAVAEAAELREKLAEAEAAKAEAEKAAAAAAKEAEAAKKAGGDK
jgi:septal ring factor EnvC (AmiA/AmiB activator)